MPTNFLLLTYLLTYQNGNGQGQGSERKEEGKVSARKEEVYLVSLILKGIENVVLLLF